VNQKLITRDILEASSGRTWIHQGTSHRESTDRPALPPNSSLTLYLTIFYLQRIDPNVKDYSYLDCCCLLEEVRGFFYGGTRHHPPLTAEVGLNFSPRSPLDKPTQNRLKIKGPDLRNVHELAEGEQPSGEPSWPTREQVDIL
jgi:hypothetical protein